MNEFEASQPPPNPSDDASIREIMDHDGTSYAEARRKWEMMKAKSQIDKQELEEEDNNG